ncbi:hypothetical protein GYMLUDRAFT_251843 [Collybiopsis luxurians FD-317 M1]|uniref:Uncharacterized protein n=1 Tax=Collybiopsis luxurians FD-317 M1 TaxID=944289 RepID=A0A0D0BQ18_9AGAR|nr:hypothetical protein GYMLUDRAFT_251843 [Collybiopsis luxurians FD-317 M1]
MAADHSTKPKLLMDYLYQRRFIFDRYAASNVSVDIQTMNPPYPQIFDCYLFASGILNGFLIPVALLHDRQSYRSVADLEICPWIDL